MPFSQTNRKVDRRPILRKQSVGGDNLTSSQKRQIYKSLKNAGAFFCTTSWCGWSKRQKALLESLGQEFVGLIKEDMATPPDGVTGFPSLVFPKDKAHLFGGKNVLSGYLDADKLQAVVRRLG